MADEQVPYVEGDYGYLLKYIEIRNQTASGYENDMKSTLEALHRQISYAQVLLNDWNFTKGDENFVLAGNEEQALRSLHLLRSLEVVRETIFKYVTRYVFTDRLYQDHARMDRLYSIHREGWLNQRHKYEVDPKAVLTFVCDRLKGLEKMIDELSRENATAERKFRDFNPEREPEAHRRQLLRILREDLTLERQSSSKEVAELKERLNAQRNELKRLREALQAMDIQNKEVIDPSEIVVVVDAADKVKRSVLRSERKSAMWEPAEEVPAVKEPDVWEPAEEEVQDDDTYFERMMEEVQGEEEAIPEEQGAQVQLAGQLEETMAERQQEGAQVDPNADNQRAEMIQVHNQRVSELRRAIQEYEDILRNFPFRNLGDSSRGVDCNVKCAFCGDMGRHYSDSCPLVIESEYRYNIVRTHGICPRCLGGCLPGRCKFPPRECWYCEKLRGTRVEDLILNDGHHRALCPVPDARIVVRERLNRAIEELDHELEELDHLQSNE